MEQTPGTWVAQSVKCPTPDFDSGHDLMVHEFGSCMGLCTDPAKPAWDSLSPPPLLMLSLSKYINELKKI